MIRRDAERVHVGPVTLDVSMARLHGWTDEDIDEAVVELGTLSRLYLRRARRLHPERYNGDVFVGVPNGAKWDGVERRRRR